MITIGTNYGKLKTSLRLASTRLKILQHKKIELVEKLKLEVANHVKNGKYMKAKLSAQTIIRDEAAVEAMELIEMYCNQILDRYELFQQMKVPDESLVTPITSLIWVAPYYQNYVEELKVISEQFNVKYGARACKGVLRNKCDRVNPELIERVRQFTPSDEKVDKCLEKICSKHGIAYTRNCLESTVTKNDKEFKSNSLTVSDSDSQFTDKEINKTKEPFLRKKLFKEKIFKHKSNKTTPQNLDSVNNSVSRESSQENLHGNERRNKCETVTDLDRSSESSSGANVDSEQLLEDESLRKNRNISSENKADICEASAPADLHFYDGSFRFMCPDPPPPYSYQCPREGKNYGTWEDFLEFQLPSCPTEIPSSSSSPELEDEEKTSKK